MSSRILFKNAGPTDYAVKYANGKAVKEGLGMTAWKTPGSTFAIVPQNLRPIPFRFKETTSDGQSVTVVGEVNVVLSAKKALTLYDFSLNESGEYRSDGVKDADNVARTVLRPSVRAEVAVLSLKEALTAMASIEAKIEAKGSDISESMSKKGLGFEGVVIQDITANISELEEAIAAKEREVMLGESDDAIAQRRLNAAEKDREIRIYEAETAENLEAQRTSLLETRNANIIAEAKTDAEATEIKLKAVGNNPNAAMIESLARLAEGGVENLHITPEMVSQFKSLFTKGA